VVKKGASIGVNNIFQLSNNEKQYLHGFSIAIFPIDRASSPSEKGGTAADNTSRNEIRPLFAFVGSAFA
jgi:hypothetical protein